MKLNLSSRLQIALISAAISGLVLVGFAGLTWSLQYRVRLEAVDRELRALASRHPGLFAGRGNYERLVTSLENTYGEDYTNSVFIRLTDSRGMRVLATPPGPVPTETAGNVPERPRGRFRGGREDVEPGRTETGPHPGPGKGAPPPPVVFSAPPEFSTFATDTGKWRVGVLRVEPHTITLGMNLAGVTEEMRRLRNTFLMTVPPALFLIAAGGWWIAGRALRPLGAIADRAEKVTAQGLDQRIPQAEGSPEARRLIEVLNGMMDRLEASFKQATRFSADASHELKTPLAIMHGELEAALRSAPAGSEQQRLLGSLLEETGRLGAITRSLLLLAQADAGQLKLAKEPLDLTAETRALLEDGQALAEARQIRVEAELAPECRVLGDRALLRMAMLNLVTNAIKYGEQGGVMTLKLAPQADNQLALVICNTGPGISPEEREKVFDRFYRGRRSPGPSEGVGLGLSLAREIARAHGGDVRLAPSDPGHACFEVRLPAMEACGGGLK